MKGRSWCRTDFWFNAVTRKESIGKTAPRQAASPGPSHAPGTEARTRFRCNEPRPKPRTPNSQPKPYIRNPRSPNRALHITTALPPFKIRGEASETSSSPSVSASRVKMPELPWTLNPPFCGNSSEFHARQLWPPSPLRRRASPTVRKQACTCTGKVNQLGSVSSPAAFLRTGLLFEADKCGLARGSSFSGGRGSSVRRSSELPAFVSAACTSAILFMEVLGTLNLCS